MTTPLLSRLLSTWLAATAFALVPAHAAPPPKVAAAPPPKVAAASDLQFALTEIAAAYKRDTGLDVKLAFGSSGNFRQQVAQGAPFEIFLSADEGYVAALAAEGHTVDGGVRYATGRIVLFVPAGGALALDATLADLKSAVTDGRVRRFAIANPEHAPYGRAAREALQRAGAWDALQPHLVYGENVSQAAQFATSGAAQGGIFAYSLALAPAVAGRGSYVLLPASMHAPLHQRMVLLKSAGAPARAFYAYLQQPAARALFRRYGFVLPDE
ncbi:MAG: molybdate ABC transporter substrate-binding protein [Burkholderiales bacterium]|nr:molybdate ABC transporter substrate-binding protein [Burkholderiales bacterium]